MHRELVLQAFKKVENEQALEKKTHIAEFLSDFIFEDCSEPYGEKILRVNYNKAISDNEDNIELKPFASNSLSHYLGYEDFASFKKQNIEEGEEQRGTTKINTFLSKHKNKLIYSVVLIAIFSIIGMATINTQRWMVWETDRYIEVSFDLNKYELNTLKVYKEDRIANFKKITPDCSTKFFKENGTENLWYGKNKKRELQYFTSLGFHPETSGTLKKITEYMIKTHICKSYKR